MDKNRSKATIRENESKCLHTHRIYLKPGQNDFLSFFVAACLYALLQLLLPLLKLLRLPLKCLGVEMREISMQLAKAEWGMPDERLIVVIFISFSAILLKEITYAGRGPKQIAIIC